MNPRTGLALALLAAVTAGAPAADAAVRKPLPCRQILDDTGDATVVATPSRDSLDIVSADIATGTKNLVAALRIKSLAADPTLVLGATYSWSWNAGGVQQGLYYRTYATGEKLATFDTNGSAAGGEVSVKFVADPSTSTITWTVPRKLVTALKKRGAKLTGLTVATGQGENVMLPTGTFQGSFVTDSAETAKPYVDLTATCLKGT
jgi:hypothetical protein